MSVSVVMATPPVNGRIDAVERRHPAVVVETHVAAGRVAAGATATHPEAGATRQRLAERLVVPAASRHVATAAVSLALLTGVVAVTGIGHPERVGGPHAVVVDHEQEVAAAALECGEAPGGQ